MRSRSRDAHPPVRPHEGFTRFVSCFRSVDFSLPLTSSTYPSPSVSFSYFPVNSCDSTYHHQPPHHSSSSSSTSSSPSAFPFFFPSSGPQLSFFARPSFSSSCYPRSSVASHPDSSSSRPSTSATSTSSSTHSSTACFCSYHPRQEGCHPPPSKPPSFDVSSTNMARSASAPSSYFSSPSTGVSSVSRATYSSSHAPYPYHSHHHHIVTSRQKKLQPPLPTSGWNGHEQQEPLSFQA
jgi:hypothetical protein